MFGVLFGIGLGATEVWLLKTLANGVTKGAGPPLWTVPLKLLAFPVFLLPVAFFWKDQLALSGIAAAVCLISGVVWLVCGSKKGKGGKA